MHFHVHLHLHDLLIDYAGISLQRQMTIKTTKKFDRALESNSESNIKYIQTSFIIDFGGISRLADVWKNDEKAK